MAEKRMFSKSIIDSDEFLEMPATAQLLYFHLAMRADDDGFIDKPKAIMRACGGKDDDMRILIARQYILPFDSGVVVVKHWRVHNYIRSDRYIETKYKSEKSQLLLDEDKAYVITDTSGIPSVNQRYTKCQPMVCQVSSTDIDLDIDLEKEILPNGSTKKRGFAPPTIADVQGYACQMGYTIDANRFCDFYESKGWMVGKNKMKDWKAAVRNWAKGDADRRDRGVSGRQQSASKPNRFHNYQQRDTDYDALVAQNDPLMTEAIEKAKGRK